MNKIAYIGHSFHQKTKSTKFFIDILLNYYSVDFYWTLPLKYKSDFEMFELDKKEYRALLFFQILPTVEELVALLKQGITPEELAQQGVPPEMIEQAIAILQQEVQTGQPQGQPMQGGLAEMYMAEGAV